MAVNWGGVAGMIVFYLLILAIGLWAARRSRGHGKDTEHAMVGDRSFGWRVGVLTLISTWVGGGFVNGTAEVVYTSGLLWAQAPWGFSLSFVVDAFFFAEKMRAANYVTMIDPFSIKYGAKMGGILFISALMGELLWCATILTALGSTMSVILNIDRYLSVIISACVATLYTFVGGLYSVAYTDIAQLTVIFFGLWLCFPFTVTNPASASIAANSDLWVGEWDNKYVGVWLDNALLLIMGGVPWQAYFQRALSTKSPKHAKYMTLAASAGCIIVSIPAYLMGAVGATTDWSAVQINLNRTNPADDPSIVLPAIIQYLTPPAVAFFGLGAISAAVMSSTDSSILSATSMFVRNVYRNVFRPKASDLELMITMKITLVAVAAVATILALTADSIYSLFILCGDVVYVNLFPQLVCVVHMERSNTYGSVLGLIVGLVLRIGGGEPTLNLPPFIYYPFYSESDGQLFAFRTLAMLCSLVTCIVGSLISDAIFRRGWLDTKWDIFRCFEDHAGVSDIGANNTIELQNDVSNDDKGSVNPAFKSEKGN
ncbi:high affinity choline transporter 1-like [Diadema setosum]|uniref:high affinity choline transporter 1-like n=1 Tax=Diadema setosum TaxID=31175 RepID=UPI003B3A0D38